MPDFYLYGIDLIDSAWLLFAIVWTVMAFRTKRSVYRQPIHERIVYVLPAVFAFLLFRHFPGMREFLIPLWPQVVFTGVAMCWAGIAFAIWARLHLAGNWSGIVTLKQDHELVQTGPYQLVRHPIYSGLLLAVAGTVLALAPTGVGAAAIALVTFMFGVKLHQEEKLMLRQFGERYEAYKKKVKGIVPFVI